MSSPIVVIVCMDSSLRSSPSSSRLHGSGGAVHSIKGGHRQTSSSGRICTSPGSEKTPWFSELRRGRELPRRQSIAYRANESPSSTIRALSAVAPVAPTPAPVNAQAAAPDSVNHLYCIQFPVGSTEQHYDQPQRTIATTKRGLRNKGLRIDSFALLNIDHSSRASRCWEQFAPAIN